MEISYCGKKCNINMQIRRARNNKHWYQWCTTSSMGVLSKSCSNWLFSIWVLDVALANCKLYVLEANLFNASNFYDCNRRKIVKAVEAALNNQLWAISEELNNNCSELSDLIYELMDIINRDKDKLNKILLKHGIICKVNKMNDKMIQLRDEFEKTLKVINQTPRSS